MRSCTSLSVDVRAKGARSTDSVAHFLSLFGEETATVGAGGGPPPPAPASEGEEKKEGDTEASGDAAKAPAGLMKVDLSGLRVFLSSAERDSDCNCWNALLRAVRRIGKRVLEKGGELVLPDPAEKGEGVEWANVIRGEMEFQDRILHLRKLVTGEEGGNAGSQCLRWCGLSRVEGFFSALLGASGGKATAAAASAPAVEEEAGMLKRKRAGGEGEGDETAGKETAETETAILNGTNGVSEGAQNEEQTQKEKEEMPAAAKKLMEDGGIEWDLLPFVVDGACLSDYHCKRFAETIRLSKGGAVDVLSALRFSKGHFSASGIREVVGAVSSKISPASLLRTVDVSGHERTIADVALYHATASLAEKIRKECGELVQFEHGTDLPSVFWAGVEKKMHSEEAAKAVEEISEKKKMPSTITLSKVALSKCTAKKSTETESKKPSAAAAAATVQGSPSSSRAARHPPPPNLLSLPAPPTSVSSPLSDITQAICEHTRVGGGDSVKTIELCSARVTDAQAAAFFQSLSMTQTDKAELSIICFQRCTSLTFGTALALGISRCCQRVSGSTGRKKKRVKLTIEDQILSQEAAERLQQLASECAFDLSLP